LVTWYANTNAKQRDRNEEERSMSENRHPFADERFNERWPSTSEWHNRRRRVAAGKRRRRVEAGAHEGVSPRGNPEAEDDKIRPRSEEYARILGH
jgi:hypothetical protein